MRFDLHSSYLPCQPVAIAAPRPVIWLLHETFLNRVAMDVAKLLDKLLLREDVEVEVANLPELLSTALEMFRSFTL